jgi:hypothetical protein
MWKFVRTFPDCLLTALNDYAARTLGDYCSFFVINLESQEAANFARRRIGSHKKGERPPQHCIAFFVFFYQTVVAIFKILLPLRLQAHGMNVYCV